MIIDPPWTLLYVGVACRAMKIEDGAGFQLLAVIGRKTEKRLPPGTASGGYLFSQALKKGGGKSVLGVTRMNHL